MNTIHPPPSGLISLAQLVDLNCEEPMESKSIKSQLSNYIGIVGLTHSAVTLFLNGNMPDPLVGENACQIRATMYCHLSDDLASIQELKKLSLMLASSPMVATTINVAGIPLPKDKRSSLSEVLKSAQMDVFIPSEMSQILRPILLGHVLTVSKVSVLSINKSSVSLQESNDSKLLAGLSSSFAKDLIKESRKALSNISISYLRSEASLLPMTQERDILSSMMEPAPKGAVLSDPLGLQTAPLLVGMKILLASMKVHNTAIILKDRLLDTMEQEKGTATLIFEPTGQDGSYEVVKDLKGVDKKKPAFIIEAVAITDKSADVDELASSLATIGIEKIILANCAAHPQYGGKNKTVEPPRTDEREDLKDLAMKLGLCDLRPELCRIYHIFSGMIGKELPAGVGP